jgi:SAM-dependent methyltransferase
VTPSAAELEPLRRLVVARLGLLLSAWERNAVLGHPPPDWLAAGLQPEEQLVFRLLVAPRPIPTAEVTATLGDTCVAALARLGVIRGIGANFESVGLRLRCVSGLFLLSGDGGPGCYVHFGIDSLALIDAAMSVRSAARGLELCCGGAGAAIALARTHDHVTACELRPNVAGIARANVVLANLTNIDVHCGDLWMPVLGERFDTILVNPPFSPSVGGRMIDPVANAGVDGLDFARAIWSSAETYLSPGGVLVLLTGMFSDGTTLLAQSELVALANQNNWLIEVIELDPPCPVERLTVPVLQTEPIEARMRELRTLAQMLGASHYQVALLRMGAHDRPGLVRCPAYFPSGETLGLRPKAARAPPASDRELPRQPE